MKNPTPTILLSTMSLALLASCQEEAKMSEKMNVLFIPVDDLRPELSCYGVSEVISPNIDKLASRGTVFNRAYCQESISNPSRSSLLTGLRPDQIKVWDLNTHFRTHAPDVTTLPQHFKNSGYNTVGYGKIFHNIFHDTISWTVKHHIDGFPFDPDATYVSEENNEICNQKIEALKKRGVSTVDQLGYWYVKASSIECEDVEDTAYYDGLQTEAAIAEMEKLAKSDEPFFLAVGYYRPHLPFTAPKKYWDLYDRDKIPVSEVQQPAERAPEYAIGNSVELRSYIDQKDTPYSYDDPMDLDRQRELKHGYYASVSYIDAQIGKLMAALEDNGLVNNTIVVIWGDNGYKLGEYNSWCKQSNFEVDTRIPLIVIDPRQGKGVKQDALVEMVDIYPSLCEMAGIAVPEALAGESFVDLLDDATKVGKPYAYSQYLRGRFGIDYIKAGVEQMGYTVRSDKYRFVEWYEWDKETDTRGEYICSELYDHQTDPLETKNVVDDTKYSEIIAEHSKAIASMFK